MSVFKSAGVAIITPFKEDDYSVNYDAFAELIDFQIDNGKFCIDYTKKRVPVIAGSGSNCTQTAMNLSKELAGYGADGLLVIHPYYNKGTQNGLYKHFKMVADASDGCPIILYNVPSRTGGNINPETVARLVKEVPNIVGIKEASGNISQIVKIMTLTDGNIDLYSGNDDQVVPLMSMGGLGVISVVSNIAPRAVHDMCEKMLAGDVKGAAQIQKDTLDLCENLFSEVNPIPVKKAVNLMGFNAGPLRMPLTEMEDAHAKKLEEAMRNFGILK